MKVLIVEDDPGTRLILSRMLIGRGYEVVACATAEEAVKAYTTAFYPLLFLDLFLPGMDGFSLCQWIRSQPDGDQHLILVGTASDRKEDLQKILDAGADDYITKPYQADVLDVRLVIAQQRVRNIEMRATLEASLRQERERLRYLATHDPLTKLLNRTVLMETLQEAVQAARGGSRSVLIYVDLDNFKLINDSLGHTVGDKVLAEVATVLQKSVRGHDVPFRLGGDEFAIVLRDIGLDKAKLISERILSRIQDFAFSDSTKTFIVGASIGITFIDGTVEGEEVMAFADSACYSAKAHGRNRVEVYDIGDESMAELRSQGPRAAEIKEAITADRFEILFQPIVDLQTLAPSLYEVLVRLPSNGKLLLPGTFLPAAERFNLIPEIDRQVINKALPHLNANSNLHLAINLSGQSFADQTLANFIEASFKAAGVEPCRATFEITETAMISNLAAARTMMRQLSGAGFRFALDDFGAGFSSFSYLKDLVPNYLKIDGSFVRDAENDHSKWIFVEMMNDIAHRLKIKSIAEFVAMETTLGKLREIGVDFAQGFLFGEPGPLPGIVSSGQETR
ncbi:MAG TPA: EAL domain-containing protein [Chthoniobacterales bacterium]|nr:EAL domain-containing protein [Chthoniobacterales bacterium]